MEIVVILEGACGEVRRLRAKPGVTLDDVAAFAEEAVFNGAYMRATVEVDGHNYCDCEV